jgi:hypothetical protein
VEGTFQALVLAARSEPALALVRHAGEKRKDLSDLSD